MNNRLANLHFFIVMVICIVKKQNFSNSYINIHNIMHTTQWRTQKFLRGVAMKLNTQV